MSTNNIINHNNYYSILTDNDINNIKEEFSVNKSTEKNNTIILKKV